MTFLKQKWCHKIDLIEGLIYLLFCQSQSGVGQEVKNIRARMLDARFSASKFARGFSSSLKIGISLLSHNCKQGEISKKAKDKNVIT